MMRLNFDMQVLNQMSEGVILLNRQGQVIGQNTAAKEWVQRCKAMDEPFKRIIDQVVQGRMELPIKMGLLAKPDLAGTPLADAWLCRDGLQNYAIFIAPHKLSASSPKQTEDRFISLLGNDVLQEMSTLRGLLHVTAGNAEERELAICKQSELVDTLLTEISGLAMLMQHEYLADEARVEMDKLITQLLPTLQAAHHNPYVFKAGSVQQGVLFGKVSWLTYALRVLLQSLGQSAPPGAQIDVQMHQMGGFMVLNGSVAGKHAIGLNASSTDRQSIAANDDTAAHRALAQMMMCKRIIELHAGKLKFNFMTDMAGSNQHLPQMESFTLTLATGMSNQQKTASCAECPVALQAQAYAQDMAVLLSQQQTN